MADLIDLEIDLNPARQNAERVRDMLIALRQRELGMMDEGYGQRARSLVLGQGSFTRSAQNDDAQTGNDGAAPTARTLAQPAGVAFIGSDLVVSDTYNHRALVFQRR